MRIVITGGTGFLGRHTVALAVAAGHEIVAVDSKPAEVPGAKFLEANLLDREAARAFLAGADALIHLGNHSHAGCADAQTVLAENTAMNANVFYAAVERDVPRIVFASSIQAMSGGPLMPGLRYPPPPLRRLPALPVNGDTPAHAGNAYGIGKVFGEQLLALLARQNELQAVAIRFPWLASPAHSKHRAWERATRLSRQAELFAWLRVEEAARLLLACVVSPLPGFRIYQPTEPLPPDWPDAESLADEHLPDAPRHHPGKPLTCLVDISRITQETGWAPSSPAP